MNVRSEIRGVWPTFHNKSLILSGLFFVPARLVVLVTGRVLREPAAGRAAG